ncbi:MAG: hypothetical protein R6V32_12350 [Bacteroidales bacterium]
MKKYCTLLIVIFISCFNSYAQWFADIRLGYAIPVVNDPKPLINTMYYNHNAMYGYGEVFMAHNMETDDYNDLGENIPAYYVLNSGSNFSFDFGYQFSKILRISFNGFYLNSSCLPYEKIEVDEYILTNSFENTITSFQHNNDSDGIASTGIAFSQLNIDSKLQQFSPFIKIALYKKINKWNFSVYLNQGVSFYFIKKHIEILSHGYEHRQKQIINEKYNKMFKYTGQGGVQLSYQLSDNIGIFTDISFLYMNLTPDEGFITYRSYVNEQYDETIDAWITNDSEFNEKEEITYIRTDDYNHRYRKITHYKNNAMNFSLGLRYYFGSTKTKDNED